MPRHIPVPGQTQHPLPRPSIPRLPHHHLTFHGRPLQRRPHGVVARQGQEPLEAAGRLPHGDGGFARDAREAEARAGVLAPEFEVAEAGALFVVVVCTNMGGVVSRSIDARVCVQKG